MKFALDFKTYKNQLLIFMHYNNYKYLYKYIIINQILIRT